MQFDHRTTARLLMQAIDILRDDRRDDPPLFHSGQRPMPRCWAGQGHACPTSETARPITLAYGFRTQEILMLDRLRMLPVAMMVPIRRNAARRAQAGTGKEGDRAPVQQSGEPLDALLDLSWDGRDWPGLGHAGSNPGGSGKRREQPGIVAMCHPERIANPGTAARKRLSPRATRYSPTAS